MNKTVRIIGNYIFAFVYVMLGAIYLTGNWVLDLFRGKEK